MAFLRGSKLITCLTSIGRSKCSVGERALGTRGVIKSMCTQVLSQDSKLDRSLRRLDQEVRRLGRVSRRELVDVFEELKMAKHATSTQSLLILRCCGNLLQEEPPQARTVLVDEIWNTLHNINVPLDISHYNALLRVYLENEYPFSPTEFLFSLEKKGIEPNRVTFQRLVERYCQEGDIDGATYILEFMRTKQLPVNENIFNSLILGHFQAGDTKSAVDTINVMKNASLEPSAKTYTTLLCGYAKYGDIENIKKLLEECKYKDINLINQDYLDVLCSLAVNNHHIHIDEIIGMLQSTVGYKQDLFNAILKLVNKTQFSVAKKLIFFAPQGENEQHDSSLIRYGNFFLRHFIKANCPIEEILTICREFKERASIKQAYFIAAESFINEGQTTNAYAVLEILKNEGHPIRHHYFWPLIVSQCKAKDVDGVVNVLKSMLEKFDLPLQGETLWDYAIPSLMELTDDQPDVLITKLQSIGVSLRAAVEATIYNLLVKNNIPDALKLSQKYDVVYNPFILRNYLVQAYNNSKNSVAFAGMLFELYSVAEKFGVSQINSDSSEESPVFDRHEFLSRLVLDSVSTVRHDKSRLIDLLQTLNNEGLTISYPIAERVVQRVGDDMITSEMSKILEDLTKGDKRTLDRASTSDISADSEQSLKALVERLNAMGKPSHNIKKRLLTLYCKNKDLGNADKLWKELKSEGISASPVLYAMLIDLYTANEKLDEALNCFSFASDVSQDFFLNRMTIIKLTSLMVQMKDVDYAIKFLNEQHQQGNQKNTYIYDYLCKHLLNLIAEQGDAENLQKMFNTLLECKFIEVNNHILGPLINVHLVRNDLDSALKQFEECFLQHRCTPLKNRLTCRLIEAEDAIALQKLTDISTKVHGEVNSLYDLVFAFAECKRVQQARKILETPGLFSRPDRIESACERFMHEGNVIALESLIEATKHLTHIDSTKIYQCLLLAYCQADDLKNALETWDKIQEDSIVPSDETLGHFAQFLEQKGHKVPFTIPKLVSTRVFQKPEDDLQETTLQKFTAALEQSQLSEALKIFESLSSDTKKKIALKQSSELIEKLTDSERISDAYNVLLSMTEVKKHPFVRVSKSVLRKISSLGDVDKLLAIGENLNNYYRYKVMFHDCLCDAYVVAGRSSEYLDILESSLDNITKSEGNNFKNKFPSNALLNLLRKSPELLPRFQKICEKSFLIGTVAPYNILWLYYIIEKQFSAADELWNKYLTTESKLKYYPVCQVAATCDDISMAKYIVDKLNNSTLTAADKGLAYSTVIDIMLSKEMTKDAVEYYNESTSVAPYLQESTLSHLQNASKALGVRLDALTK